METSLKKEGRGGTRSHRSWLEAMPASTGNASGKRREHPRRPLRNLIGDPWHSDGRRAVIVISPTHEA